MVTVVPTICAPSLADRKMRSVLSPSVPLWLYWNVLLWTSGYGKLSPASYGEIRHHVLHILKCPCQQAELLFV